MTEEEKAAKLEALAELGELAALFHKREEAANEAREALHAAIARRLGERTVTPGEAAKQVGYDRNHIGRIARAAGIPPLRRRTVQRIQEDAPADGSPGTAA